MTPDPKQGKRIIDPEARLRLLLMNESCAACGAPASNAHHVIQKGAPHFGDDVIENLVPICGSGTMRCHGAFHGGPYVVERQVGGYERRDQQWVASRIGEHILRHRPDVVLYVLGKLGEEAGREYLSRTYFVGGVTWAQ